MILILLGGGLAGCDAFDFISDQDNVFGDNETIAKGIERVTSIRYDEYTYRAYTSSLTYENTEDTFSTYVEDIGFIVSEDYDDIADFFVQQNGVGHGGIVYEDDTHYKYIYFTGSDHDMQIFTMTAHQDAIEAHASNGNDTDDNDTTEDPNDSALMIPDEDVAGEDLPVLDRHPDAIRVTYTELVVDEELDYFIEYLVEASLDDVFNYYETLLNTSKWTIDEQVFVPEEGGQFIAYYNDEYGLTLGIESETDDVTWIYIYATEYQTTDD